MLSSPTAVEKTRTRRVEGLLLAFNIPLRPKPPGLNDEQDDSEIRLDQLLHIQGGRTKSKGTRQHPQRHQTLNGAQDYSLLEEENYRAGGEGEGREN
jgi:hypothetical protein